MRKRLVLRNDHNSWLHARTEELRKKAIGGFCHSLIRFVHILHWHAPHSVRAMRWFFFLHSKRRFDSSSESLSPVIWSRVNYYNEWCAASLCVSMCVGVLALTLVAWIMAIRVCNVKLSPSNPNNVKTMSHTRKINTCWIIFYFDIRRAQNNSEWYFRKAEKPRERLGNERANEWDQWPHCV